MKLLLTFSKESGKTPNSKKLAYIKNELGKYFEVECFPNNSQEEAFEKYQNTDAEAVVVLGGDGHFNNLLNAIMPLKKKPKIGYLNFGTLGDVGRLFGLNGNLKHDLKIITDGMTKEYDVGELKTPTENRYFMYVACVGAYSNIPYVSPKKRLGRLTYYFRAIGQLFKKTRIHYSLNGNENETKEAPFIMFLNGTHMAGFKINKQAIFDDGEFEFYETKNGIFNGLLNYFPVKRQKFVKKDKISLTFKDQIQWCLDGEAGPKGSADLLVNKRAITVFFEAK